MKRQQVEQYAQRVLADTGVHNLPVNPSFIASRYGALVVSTKAEDGESGFCLREQSRTIIGVNGSHSEHRQRFTIAHEIGHLLIHEGRELIVDKSVRISYRNEVSSMATNLEEIEANAFAAALLMPDPWVRQGVERLLPSSPSPESLTEFLAREFDVSIQAMNFRLMNLGIVFG